MDVTVTVGADCCSDRVLVAIETPAGTLSIGPPEPEEEIRVVLNQEQLDAFKIAVITLDPRTDNARTMGKLANRIGQLEKKLAAATAANGELTHALRCTEALIRGGMS